MNECRRTLFSSPHVLNTNRRKVGVWWLLICRTVSTSPMEECGVCSLHWNSSLMKQSVFADVLGLHRLALLSGCLHCSASLYIGSLCFKWRVYSCLYPTKKKSRSWICIMKKPAHVPVSLFDLFSFVVSSFSFGMLQTLVRAWWARASACPLADPTMSGRRNWSETGSTHRLCATYCCWTTLSRHSKSV